MRKPRITTLSPDEAATALANAETILARWSGESADQAHAAEVLAGELAEAQARAADDLLDAEDAEDDAAAVARVAGELERRRTEQGLAVQAAERAAERVAAARRGVLRARAGSLRTRVKALRDAAASRQARTDQILAELAEFEAVGFGPTVRHSTTGVASAGIIPRTLTQKLVGRAQWLEDHAERLEHLADQGADDQVGSVVSQPLPEVIDVELAAAAVPAAV